MPTPHEGDVTCSRCGVSYRQIHPKCFLKGEKICYKMVYYTMYLDSVNHQKLRCIVKNLSWRKSDFSERGLALKGLIVDKHPNLRFTLSEKLKKLKLCR